MVLLRTHVQEWVQPKPTVTNGEAWVGLDNGAPVVVVVLAAAACLPLSGVGVRVVWDESAAAVVEGDVEFFPTPGCVAVVDVDGVSPTQDNTFYPACVAVASVGAFADSVQVAVDGWVGVFLAPQGVPVAHLIGDAEIVFPEGASSGSAPIFPFRFPMLFVIPGFTVITAAAEVAELSGDGVTGVGVSGDAVVSSLTGEGVTESGVIGDNLYAVYGVAGVGFSGAVSQFPAVLGLSGVVFDGAVSVILGGVFPTLLPFTFV